MLKYCCRYWSGIKCLTLSKVDPSCNPVYLIFFCLFMDYGSVTALWFLHICSFVLLTSSCCHANKPKPSENFCPTDSFPLLTLYCFSLLHVVVELVYIAAYIGCLHFHLSHSFPSCGLLYPTTLLKWFLPRLFFVSVISVSFQIQCYFSVLTWQNHSFFCYCCLKIILKPLRHKKYLK